MEEFDYLIRVNPDKNKLNTVLRLLKSNQWYCFSQAGRKEENKCRCKHFRETGECYCGMYIRIPVIEVR